MENNQQLVEIKIKHLSHDNYTIKIGLDSTVDDLKKEIEKESKIKAEELKLIFKGKVLRKGDDILRDLKVEHGSTLHMIKT